MLLVGNKADIGGEDHQDTAPESATPSSYSSQSSAFPANNSIRNSQGTQQRVTKAPEGREVPADTASRWASTNNIPVSVEVSAFSGDNVEEVFARLARTILTKIELGEINPDDPQSGIQYGDSGWGGTEDGGSIKSGMTVDDSRRRKTKRKGVGGMMGGLREWEDVFRPGSSGSTRRGGCC